MSQDTWKEEYAYSVGVQAFIYAFPLLNLTRLRYKWASDASSFPYTAPNHLYHFRNLVGADYKYGGSPNNDTLYSWGFLDLSREPIVLAHPEMGARYFAFELADMYSDNFGYVGKQSTGSRAGAFLIAGPDWRGARPDGVRDIIRARTPCALVFGRTFVEDEKDVAAVNQLQDQFQLVPLSLWGKPDFTLPEHRNVLVPVDGAQDPLADWRTINRAMAENPPPDKDRQLLKLFASVGIGPGLGEHLDGLDEASKRGLARAAAQGLPMLKAMLLSGELNKVVNGWFYPPPNLGRSGLDDDFRVRAKNCMGGILCNDPDEAIYMVAYKDSEGQALDGAGRYTLRFEKGETPPVKEFWSLTVVGPDQNLVGNPINRYAIRDRTPGIRQEADGAVVFYLQPDSPGEDKASNWLPTPKAGRFHLTLRAYVPAEPILQGQWQPPAVRKSN